MAAIGQTELTATQQALITSLVQMTLKQKSILVPTVTDYSRFAVPGAASVAVPRRDQFSAADKTENSDLSKQELTFATDTISLDKHKAILAELERKPSAQSVVDVRSEIIMEMAAELALQVDKDLLTEIDDASAAAPDHIIQLSGGTNDEVEAVDILEARRLLNVQNVPQDERWMLINPNQEKVMLQIANFIEVDKYGPNDAISNAELGRIYGFRVLMHTEVADTDVYWYHKSAVGWALQGAPEFDQDKNLDNVADKFLLHQFYGMTELDSGKRQVKANTTGA